MRLFRLVVCLLLVSIAAHAEPRTNLASFGAGVLRMTDVWDSEEQFGTFVQTRILPGLRQLGIPGQPDMITQTAHEVTAIDGT